jgi:hypothetical protein
MKAGAQAPILFTRSHFIWLTASRQEPILHVLRTAIFEKPHNSLSLLSLLQSSKLEQSMGREEGKDNLLPPSLCNVKPHAEFQHACKRILETF